MSAGALLVVDATTGETLPVDQARLDSTGLTLADGISYEDWITCGDYLRRVEGACQWWLGDWLAFGDKKAWGEMYAEAMDVAERESQTLMDYKWVAKAIDFSSRNEKVSFGVHRQIAAMPKEARPAAIAQAAEGGWTVREARKRVRRAKAELIGRQEQAWPSGQYRVIYADPPWSYGNEMAEYATTPEDHYPVMSTQAICDMDVQSIAMDDAVLFLWTTCPHLPEALNVCEAWGFKYKTHFVWDKVKHNMGHYSSVRHEVLFVCTRGSCTPEVQKLFDSVYSEERTTHSQKPQHFRTVIDTLYPSGPRVELFARAPHNGWDSWGNEHAG